ncbi:MAG: hypothetical protein CTY34_12445 [Methylobacter sp.]|nr:MAG: hypothetical protein CTY34_12445 [Methylobacter sp.]PPD04555.1 MAG: hypothetical protein CTY29_04875 [Methylobacter sp.]PPD18795.1 MAG: hypothetical protein CTY24_12345 [Methylobacter sp.]
MNHPDYIAILLDKTKYNCQLTRTIFHKLFPEFSQQIIDIDAALANGDLKTAENITHKLHGTVSFCGFSDLQTLAQGLEVSLNVGKDDSAKYYFVALKQTIEEFLAKKECLINDPRLC